MLKRMLILLIALTIELSCNPHIIQDTRACDTLGYDNCNRETNGELLCAQRYIQNNALVFDVGANKGDWSTYVIQAKPSVTIYAFEPMSISFERLKNSFKNNAMVKVSNMAFSKETGIKTLFFYDTAQDTTELSGLYYRPVLDNIVGAKPKKTVVNTDTLDSFCSRNNIDHIDFLKIDTEGSEADILQGAYAMLSAKKISTIQFEYGGTYLDAHTTLEKVYRLLSSLDYTVYRIIPDGLIEIHQWHPALETFRYANYLATGTRLII